MAELAAFLCLIAAPQQEPNPRIRFPELRSAQRYKKGDHLRKIPEPVAALDNRWVTVSGNLFLRYDGEEIRQVLVTENVFAPGVGARPSVFNWVAVRFREGARPEPLTQGAPIILSGRFRIRKEGRLEESGEQLVGLYHLVDAVAGDVPNPDAPPPPDGGPGARGITFALLETARGTSQGPEITIPEPVRALDGRWVTVTGNVLVPWADEGIAEFTLAKNPWDGCCLGVPPTHFDSVAVRMAEGRVLRDRYSPVQTFSGRFRIKLEKKVGYVVSLYKLLDAVEGTVPDPAGAERPAESRFASGWVSMGVAVAGLAGVLFLMTRRRDKERA